MPFDATNEPLSRTPVAPGDRLHSPCSRPSGVALAARFARLEAWARLALPQLGKLPRHVALAAVQPAPVDLDLIAVAAAPTGRTNHDLGRTGIMLALQEREAEGRAVRRLSADGQGARR